MSALKQEIEDIINNCYGEFNAEVDDVSMATRKIIRAVMMALPEEREWHVGGINWAEDKEWNSCLAKVKEVLEGAKQ